MDGCIDGWMDRWIDRWIAGWIEVCMRKNVRVDLFVSFVVLVSLLCEKSDEVLLECVRVLGNLTRQQTVRNMVSQHRGIQYEYN